MHIAIASCVVFNSSPLYIYISPSLHTFFLFHLCLSNSGESFFVLRTEDLVDPTADHVLVPVVLRALASVGLGNVTGAAVENALERLRTTHLGSDTNMYSRVGAVPRMAYGKWRKHRAELQGVISDSVAKALLAFGYLDRV